MAKIFVSYNRESESVVQNLSTDIEALSHDVWMDQELSGGQQWWDQILDIIRKTDIFVIALDPASLRSSACQSEWRYAAALNIPIVPVLTSVQVSSALLPPLLSSVQHVDYTKPDKDSALRLARAFVSAPQRGPVPDPMPEPPHAPMSYLSNVAQKIRRASTLDYAEQSAILLDLETGLSEPETAKDCRTLLAEFSERRDLLAVISKRVDRIEVDAKAQAQAQAPPLDGQTERTSADQHNKPDASIAQPDPSNLPPLPDLDDEQTDPNYQDLNQIIDGLGFASNPLPPGDAPDATQTDERPHITIDQEKHSKDLVTGLAESAAVFERIDNPTPGRMGKYKPRFASGILCAAIFAGVFFAINTGIYLYFGEDFYILLGLVGISGFTTSTIVGRDRVAAFLSTGAAIGMWAWYFWVNGFEAWSFVDGALMGMLIGAPISALLYPMYHWAKKR